MTGFVDELFKVIRQSCSPLTWSRGVELTRGENVVGERLTDTEAVLRVASPGRAVSATVKLWPEEEDWFCDCGAKAGPCEHVVAAVIALRRAKEAGQAMPVASVTRGLVVYRFRRDGGSLALDRTIALGEEETPLPGPLSAVLSGRVPGPAINASKEDVTIDSLLQGSRSKSLTAELVAEILERLEDNDHVWLDDEKMSVGKLTTGVRLVVSDAGDGVRVRPEPEADRDEIFENGAARYGNLLRPVRWPDLDNVERAIVMQGRRFDARELGDLASRLLPDLRRKFSVELRTRRLPEVGEAVRPRLLFQTQASGELLAVLPLIVYGDPPIARVDGQRLVLLGDGKVAPERNPAGERSLSQLLQSRLGFSIGRRIEFRGEAAAKFAEKLAAFPARVEGNGLRYFGSRAELEAKFSFHGETPRLDFALPGGGPGVSAARVFQAWQDGLERVSLDDGKGWAPIPLEWLEKYGHRVLDLLEVSRDKGRVPRFAEPDAARLCAELDVNCPPELSKLREQLDTFTGIPRAKRPRDLQASLRDYQESGVDWLSFLRGSGLGALLADDMGLGKTLQTLAVLESGSLVIAPTSVLSNWVKEAARFRPGLKVCVYHGPGRALDDKADLTITTYTLLRMDADKLTKKPWRAVVLDEAQNIKNPESQVAQSAFRLEADFRVALSGTPVENRLEDLWSLFHFLNPGLLGGRTEFQKRYSWTQLQADASRGETLRKKIKPFVLRRLKREVARELPARTDVTLYCELDPSERDVYQGVRAAAQKEVLERLAHEGNVLAVLECLLRMRQAACHPGLLPNHQASDSSKLKLLRDRLEEAVAEGHKALVFSQWTSLLDLIEPHLRAMELDFARIDGSTTNRADIVERFQNPTGPKVLLMSLKAGGVGLNLTAADHVFLVDPWWNPAAEDQAADRAHRIGQDKPVFVHRLVARDTVEEKILALQERKRATAAVALDGAGGAAGITKAELLELVK